MNWSLYLGDAATVLRTLPKQSVRCCVTSPPYYGLRDYDVEGQIGREAQPTEYVARLVEVFREVRRVLYDDDDGTLWVNLGDSYARNGGTPGGGNRELMHLEGKQKRMTKVPEGSGLKPKDLLGMPWRTAFALQEDGWYLRCDIVWHKPNPMPEQVIDRPTKAHEYVFLLAKSERYFYDYKAILEPFADARMGRDGGKKKSQRNRGGRDDGLTKPSGIDPSKNGGKNKRSVWTLSSEPSREKHYASFPTKLVEPCVLAGSAVGDAVLDPFCGTSTTGVVALRHGRRFIGVDLSEEYLKISQRRLSERQEEEAA